LKGKWDPEKDSKKDFLKLMIDEGHAWPYDADGKELKASELKDLLPEDATGRGQGAPADDLCSSCRLMM
jgi:hypothetical protein